MVTLSDLDILANKKTDPKIILVKYWNFRKIVDWIFSRCYNIYVYINVFFYTEVKNGKKR